MAKKKKKKTKFWKVYKIVVCIFLVIIVIVLAVLWGSLTKYEAKAQEKRQQIEQIKTESVVEELPELEEDAVGVAIVAPSNYKIVVDGMTISGSSMFQTENLKQAEIFTDYLPEGFEFPKMAAFYVEDVEEFAKVECFDTEGNPVKLEGGEYPFYQFGFYEKELTPEQFSYFDTLVTRYVRLCLNEGELNDILGYFIKGTETYQNICKIEDVKEYSGRKSGYDVGNITVNHFNQYADNLYRVDISFVYTVRNGDTSRENPTNLDCYIVDIDGQWKVLQMDISSK